MAKKVVASETPPAESPEEEVVTEETFEAWLGKQSSDVQAKYAEHTHGLTSALKSERERARELEKGAKKLAEYEKAEAERAKAQLSETELLQAELAKAHKATELAEGKARAERVRSAIEAKAAMMGFADPSDAYTLVDLGRVELDAQGRPGGVDELLNDLARAKPYLVKTEKANARPTLNPGGGGNVTESDADKRKRLGYG